MKRLEGVVWETKARDYSIGNRAFTNCSYFYFCTRIDHHHFTLWAIPVGKSREEDSTWFLSVTPEAAGRWKGRALPLDPIFSKTSAAKETGVVQELAAIAANS